MKKCINCGRYEMNNNAYRCTSCGGSLAECSGTFCPKCGTQITMQGVNFCPACATPLTGISQVKKKNTGIIVLVAVLAVLIIGGIVAGTLIYINNQDVYVSQNDEKDEKNRSDEEAEAREVAENFMTAYSCKQIEKFSDKFYNCEPYVLEGSEMYERIEYFRDVDNDEGDIEIHNIGAERSEFEILDVEIDGDKAVVKVELTCVDQSDVRERYRVDYEWLFGAWLAYPNGIYDPDELTPAQEVEMEEKFEEENKEQLHKYHVDATETADLETDEGELFMEKHDGKWYVTDSN